MTRPAHYDIGDARSKAHLEALAQMRRLEGYHDEPCGASRLPEAFLPLWPQGEVDAAQHIPAADTQRQDFDNGMLSRLDFDGIDSFGVAIQICIGAATVLGLSAVMWWLL